ncbi:hypothetical protein J4573_37195 [Actinomadura barringtoniae]|uniref:Uncharacterized protein n=1 Tax=Actinomadura barringtoniae TaxID=1427535 RepID=A0A939PMH7_9ACTN|nr:hypothetical protein [Actinomadura barringtoniae]MBO2452778.1 hypothetical protein [Actinomadura barringtoniae]
MTETGETARRRRHGLAALLVALFAVAGLVFAYGLGHAPPMRVCTEHSTSVPSDVAALLAPGGQGGHSAGHAPGASLRKAALGHGFGHTAASGAKAPMKPPPLSPAGGCLGLAVLLGLLALGLAALPRRSGGLLPARFGWLVGPPRQWTPFSAPPGSLQVLRL